MLIDGIEPIFEPFRNFSVMLLTQNDPIGSLLCQIYRLCHFYKIELVPGSCHIFVVVAGACVVDLSLTWLFNLKLDGQQKTI